MKQRLNAKDAEEHIFGFVILNDWSGKWHVNWIYSPLLTICSSRHPGLRDEPSWSFQWQKSRNVHLTMDYHPGRFRPLPYTLPSSTNPLSILPPTSQPFHLFHHYEGRASRKLNRHNPRHMPCRSSLLDSPADDRSFSQFR